MAQPDEGLRLVLQVMKRPETLISVFKSALVIVIATSLWVVFAPSQLGGGASYIILTGNSMEPGLHRNDLVLTRNKASYQVDDIVAYRHPEIGPVVHRIVAVEGSSFVLQGDNNDWVDSHHPTDQEVIGKYWFHIPMAGKLFASIRSPAVVAIGVIILSILFFFSVKPDKVGKVQTEQETLLSGYDERIQSWLAVLAAVGIAAIVLSIFAFTRPAERETVNPLDYSHNGRFDYTADAGTGVYDGDQIQTGDPVFRNLADAIKVSYAFEFASENMLRNPSASSQLTAVISDANGWNRTAELQPATIYDQVQFTTSGLVDLTEIQRFVDNLETKTGAEARNYLLTITAVTAITGELAGQQINDQFTHNLTFVMDDAQLMIAENSEDLVPWQATTAGQVMVAGFKTNTLSILGWQVAIPLARQVSLIAFVMSIIALLLLWTVGLIRIPPDPSYSSPLDRLRHKVSR